MQLLGYFKDGEDSIYSEFHIEKPEGVEILFATYDVEGYDGSAFVLFRQDGELYEVHGSHCSCYGLEDQWKPEKTSIKALRLQNLSVYHGGLVGAALTEFLTNFETA